MATATEKQFTIGMVVSCKRRDCALDEGACSTCVESFIGENIKFHDRFALRQITTGNQSKQFSVSFVAHCRRPDCTTAFDGAEACCTASAEKCEMCLRTIVNRSIREMYGFHAKEIAVV